MGLDYSINLYFPADRVGAALRELARIAPPGDETIVRVPGGEVCIPFPSGFASRRNHDPVVLVASGAVEHFETTILFPIDEAISRRDLSSGYETVRGTEYIRIGYIYLTIRLGCLYAEFSFTAATSGMSRLFVASESIRGRFRELLAAACGVVGWLDEEDYQFHRLDDPTQTITPEPVPRVPDEDTERSLPDWTVEMLCRGLGHPLPAAETIRGCRTTDAVELARTIRAAKSFDLLPILADALQDAGCEDEVVLGHCRSGGSHTRCCWVVDLILGGGEP